MQYKRSPQRWVAIIYCYEHPSCSSSSLSTGSAQAPCATVCSGDTRCSHAAAFGAYTAVRCAGSYDPADETRCARATFFTCSTLGISGNNHSSDASERARCSSFAHASPGSGDGTGTGSHHPIGATGGRSARSAHASSSSRRTGIFAAPSRHASPKCGHAYYFHADCNCAYGKALCPGSDDGCTCC